MSAINNDENNISRIRTILNNHKATTAFLIGNEGNGLRDEVADVAECYIKIPMCGEVESLNAAVASSVLMFEAARQRR